ncbi:hypothetical protein ACN27J_23605 [Solwaraspora sp. WMMB762]|uniref:hypothetical protein n=1 Tax=Solwaraspora sp. WMMB762 TaxID=3404120 RepID=UPI003B92C9E8
MTAGPRTQLVLTVANLDTGAVASTSVMPGDIEPEPAPHGGWEIPLWSVRDELAAQVKVDRSTLRDLRYPDAERAAGLAAAHTGPGHPAWSIHFGRTVAEPPVSVDESLARLCALADLLCLDLVVEARWGVFAAGLNWDIRFETPGAAVPRDQRGYAASLPAAVDRTAVADALAGLAERSLTAPAHFLLPALRSAAPPDEIDVERLERRIVQDCGTPPPVPAGAGEWTAGAQAIWRDRRWRHTSLCRIPGPRPAIPELAPVLRRTWQPPLPPWLGEPIPSVPCPDCHATGWRHPVLTCRRCGGHGRQFDGVVVTVTNLRDRATHVEWRPSRTTSGDTAASVLESGGPPVVRLPERFRLSRLAGVFGVRPVDLLDLTGERVVPQELRDAVVPVLGDGPDPVRRYLRAAAAGRPGARLLVHATDWAELPAFDAFAALVVGLGLALRVTARDMRSYVDDPMVVHDLLWGVEALPVIRPVDDAKPADGTERVGEPEPVDEPEPIDEPLSRSVQQAIGRCLRYLELAVVESLPADPARPIPVPQQLVPPVVPDIVGRLTELAAAHAGQVMAAHLDQAGCRYWVAPSR